MILKLAVRNLCKRPFLNIVKVFGLSLALSGFLLIILLLKNELTFESFNKNAGRIYRLTLHLAASDQNHFARIYNPEFLPQMAGYFTGIEHYVRLAPVRGGIIKHEERSIIINQAFECDSTFFKIFPADLISGNPEHILDAPGSLVISAGLAEKIFGKSDPAGQVLEIPAGQYYGRSMKYTITGVMNDFPQNSHFHPEFIATPVDRNIFEGWAYTYLMLVPGADPGIIKTGFREFLTSLYKVKPEEINYEAELQKITDIHLHSDKLREIEANSNIYVIYTLAIAALILLLTGLLNYSNLTLGMAGFNDKYLFISKVSGSSPLNNFNYFATEGFIIILIATISGLIFAGITNILVARHSGLDLLKDNAPMIAIIILAFGTAGMISGMFPIFRQAKKWKTTDSRTRSVSLVPKKGLGKGIIILQFSICTALIIAVIVITRQTKYAFESGMGYKTDNIICIRDVPFEAQKKFEVFKEELLKSNSVLSVSAMMEPPGGETNDQFGFKLEDSVTNPENSDDSSIGVLPCDYSLVSLFGLEILDGSDFSPVNKDNNGSGEYLINEAAMKKLNYTRPQDLVGKRFQLITNIPSIDLPQGKIIGVLKDFHVSGIRKKVPPLVLFKMSDLWISNFLVAFRPGMKDQAVPDIRSTWEKLFPGFPFQYEYTYSMYDSVYRSEVLQSALLSVFTSVSLIICLMGLLGMTLLSTQKRTKEIGLRKINGATTTEVMLLFNFDIVKWIILSFIIAVPSGWLAMNKWLESFAYKTELSWWIFILTILLVILISLLTISVQSWKVAARNPVEALRYE